MNLSQLQATVNKLVGEGNGHLPVYVMLRLPSAQDDTIPSFHEVAIGDVFVVEDEGVVGSVNITLKGQELVDTDTIEKSKKDFESGHFQDISEVIDELRNQSS
jgi:hypothetical protein